MKRVGTRIARLNCNRCGGACESNLHDVRASQHRCETCGSWLRSPDLLDYELNDGDVDRIIILFDEV